MDKDTLIEMLAMNVEHMALSYGRDWWQCKCLVDKLKSMPRWDVQWGRRVSPSILSFHASPPHHPPPLLARSRSRSIFSLAPTKACCVARERSKECEAKGGQMPLVLTDSVCTHSKHSHAHAHAPGRPRR